MRSSWRRALAAAKEIIVIICLMPAPSGVPEMWRRRRRDRAAAFAVLAESDDRRTPCQIWRAIDDAWPCISPAWRKQLISVSCQHRRRRRGVDGGMRACAPRNGWPIIRRPAAALVASACRGGVVLDEAPARAHGAAEGLAASIFRARELKRIWRAQAGHYDVICLATGGECGGEQAWRWRPEKARRKRNENAAARLLKCRRK